MVGRLKEACNKFFINKYSQTVINYRNVNDYIVKSKVRNNSTTDVEIFAKHYCCEQIYGLIVLKWDING